MVAMISWPTILCFILQEEVFFLKENIIASHLNIVNVIGKFCEEQLRAVVYDLDPLDSLDNMIPEGKPSIFVCFMFSCLCHLNV